MNRDRFSKRLRNQAGNFVTSFSSLFLISGWVVAGALLGVQIGSLLPYGSGLAVMGTTLLGFCLGLVASSAMSPRMIQIAFRARKIESGPLRALVDELQAREKGRIQFELFGVDQNLIQGFGHNVVVTGLHRGRGIFKPAIFASESVLRGCSEDEIYSILAHELAHLRQKHLPKRIISGLVTGALGSLLTSCLILGLQLMGYREIAMALATVSAIIPVALIWLNLRFLLRTQEKEADWIAIRDFDARPLDLLNSLKKLTLWNEAGTHPLVRERMLILQGLWLSENSWKTDRSVPEPSLAA